MATAILSRYPTAKAFRQVSVRKLAGLHYDGRHRVGEELARALIEAAKTSVGSHHSEPYRLEVKYYCEDIEVLRSRLATLQRDIERATRPARGRQASYDDRRVGPPTAACLVAELGDPARFRDAAALASYVGAIPRLRQSGKRSVTGGSAVPFGNARLRHALWMPTIVAVGSIRGCERTISARLRPVRSRSWRWSRACASCCARIYSVARNRRAFVPDLRAAVTAPAAIAGGAAGK